MGRSVDDSKPLSAEYMLQTCVFARCVYGGGSITNPEKAYHLEIAVLSESFLFAIAADRGFLSN